jgi:ATP phosphoribosyltransferase regulatory subunit
MAATLRTVVDVAASHGYLRVQPPLLEAEAGLAAWLTAGGGELLRAADPETGAALAVRPDITAQVARIASTRMADAPRPLRLAYGGPVVRGRGSQLVPDRELVQAGAELIGSDSEAALVEVLSVAVEALAAAGVEGMSVDLTLPGLVAELAAGPWPVADPAAVARALDAKDAGALSALNADRYGVLLEAAGPAEEALQRLAALGAPLEGAVARLAPLVHALGRLRVTIDPTERHGFEYQSLGFSLFGSVGGQPLRGEIGRGGAYAIARPGRAAEPACGFSLYLDPLVDAGLGSSVRPRLFLPFGTPAAVGARWRAKGYATVAALAPGDGMEGCTHLLDDGLDDVLNGGTPRPLEG